MPSFAQVERWPGSAAVRLSKSRTSQTQSKPYFGSLPFSYRAEEITLSSTSSGGYFGTGSLLALADRQPIIDASRKAHNSAYGKLVAELGDTSTWANNLFEAKQSLSIIEQRATQILKFTNSLRKGDVVGAAGTLGLKKPPKNLKKHHHSKQFGNMWLEYHFGWEPMVQDVGNAVDTLTKTQFVTKSIKGNGTGHFQCLAGDSNSVGFWSDVVNGMCREKIGLKIRVTNPNAFLANQMGFVNPASVAWEAVPYSFVVDWFSNVSQVIASLSDFVGVEIQDSYTTASLEFWEGYTSNDNSGNFANFGGHSITIDRIQGFHGPELALKPFKGFSSIRAATAISLLTQKLR